MGRPTGSKRCCYCANQGSVNVCGGRCTFSSANIRGKAHTGSRQRLSTETAILAAGNAQNVAFKLHRTANALLSSLQRQGAKCIQRCWRRYSWHKAYINRAASRIQEAWRNRCRRKLYMFYRDLIRFRYRDSQDGKQPVFKSLCLYQVR